VAELGVVEAAEIAIWNSMEELVPEEAVV